MSQKLNTEPKEQKPKRGSGRLGRILRSFVDAPGAEEIMADTAPARSSAEIHTITLARKAYNGYVNELPRTPAQRRGIEAGHRVGTVMRRDPQTHERIATDTRVTVHYNLFGHRDKVEVVAPLTDPELFNVTTYWDDPTAGPQMRVAECRETQGIDGVTYYGETLEGRDRAFQRELTPKDVTGLPQTSQIDWTQQMVILPAGVHQAQRLLA